MKKVTVFLLAALMLVLTGCAETCEHSWTEADCITAKTCSQCGETEGNPLGHDWQEATCTTATQCKRCGFTADMPLGHNWVEVTCTQAKHCTGCGETMGEALGHVWTEATTEAPKTCTTCGATEGEKILSDPRFTTAGAQSLFGRWEAKVNLPEDKLEVRRFNGSLEGTYWVEFRKDGTMDAGFILKDEEAFRAAVAEAYADWSFERLEEAGVDEEEANAAAKELTGMKVEEYIRSQQNDQPVEALMEAILEKSKLDFNSRIGSFVYYVEEDVLYLDAEWTEKMQEETFEFLGNTLILYGYLECKAVVPEA